MGETPGVSRPAVFRLTLACDLKQVRQAAESVHRFLAQHGCDDETLGACDLALVEGCNNAIQYAPPSAQSQSVKIEVICEPGQVELQIGDHTGGFDWPAQLKLPDPESESGRGLFLMQSLMDSAAYLRGRNENVLVLRKSRPASDGPEARGSPLQRDLEMARQIQQSLLVRDLPSVRGFDIAVSCQSAYDVGGDFYDVMKAGDGAVLFVIADVMGKGLVAAMFAAVLRTVLRAMPELAPQPAALLDRVNHLLYAELSAADMFITAQAAYGDASTRKLTVASAGHCPLLVVGAGGGTRLISPEGMPLGILPDTAFATEVVELPEESCVLFYTDGVSEALNAAGERFGQDRLIAWLKQPGFGARTAEESKHDLADALKQFQARKAPGDDQTFVIVKTK